jgi:phospholipid/cholesterol/gamma-HCH transport system substrate-binding protein
MTSRRTREGILGLFILTTALTLTGILLWLKGNTFGQPTFDIIATFPDATGLSEGSPVRYRGSQIGQITQITPKPDGIQIRIRINQPNLTIPANADIRINQSSFLGASTLDITPSPTTLANTPDLTNAGKPLDKTCDRQIILCHNSTVQGQQGVSTEALLRASMDFTQAYSDPTFVKNLTALTASSTLTAQSLTQTSKEYALLAQTARQELKTLSAASTNTANNFSNTAQSLSATSQTANLTLSQINSLLTQNRSTLISTLDNMSQTSNSLKTAITKLSPQIDRLTSGQILQNLETLSANAAITSTNLRTASTSLSNPTTLTLLQQTLESARTTFQNTQKLTTDLDDLLGDPKIRENIRQLINGLSNLVSDSHQLTTQTRLAQTLPPSSLSSSHTQSPVRAWLAVPPPTAHPSQNPSPTPPPPQTPTPDSETPQTSAASQP